MSSASHEQPPPFMLGQRPSLDGVRGLSILLVVLCHIPSLPLQGGFIGVDVFFVLSGFLITTLLLEEWQGTGRIRLGEFYMRRALRLLPALLLVLGTVVLFSAMRESAEQSAAMRRSALLTLFYSANWFLAYGRYPRGELSPTWSLSVEEQFYIVWPLLLLVLLRAGWSRRSMALLVIAGFLASAATRAALWGMGRSPDRIFFGSDTHADGLLAGALAALLLSGRVPPKGRVLDWAAHLSLGILGLLVALGWQADPMLVLGGYVALNLGSASLVACLVASPSQGLRRIFEWAPLVWLGRLSYGVYLWHIAVFWMLAATGWPGGHLHWPVAIGLTILAAAASFYGVERPILRLKRRFGRPVSPENAYYSLDIPSAPAIISHSTKALFALDSEIEVPPKTKKPEAKPIVDRNERRTVTGVVTADKMEKTVKVRVERLVSHPQFSKTLRKHYVCYAHDEKREAKMGDRVELMESRPLSKLKHWRLVRVVEKAIAGSATDDARHAARPSAVTGAPGAKTTPTPTAKTT